MIEVRQEDRDAALQIGDELYEHWDNFMRPKIERGDADSEPIVQLLAHHRQQAEDAMRERCLYICETTVVEVPLTNGACDGASIALHTVATAIRGIDAGGEG